MLQLTKLHALGAKGRSRGGREVRPTRADPDDDVGAGEQGSSPPPCRDPDGTDRLWVVVRERPLACLCLGHGNPVASTHRRELFGRLRVDDAPTGHDERTAAPRMTAAARAIAAGSATGRGTCQIRLENSSTGQSNASACTSSGKQMVTAPVSAGSVSTRIAARSAAGQLLGTLHPVEPARDRPEGIVDRHIPRARTCSSCWSTGSAGWPAKTSAGRSSTGRRLTVARAAPVTMFVAPGPTDDVQASVESRFRIRAKPEATCTMACSLRAE